MLDKEVLDREIKEEWVLGFRENNKKLMRNLVKKELPESVLLEFFMELVQKERDLLMGEFLRAYFTEKGLYHYYRKKGKKLRWGSIEYYEYLRCYLNMGFDLDLLCKLLVTDPKGMQCDAEKFLDSILEIKRVPRAWIKLPRT